MINKIYYKGRFRINRGKLKEFNDLPDEIKERFILIKKFIDDFNMKDTDVYVTGSFYHGIWDEESDFDVLITEKNNIDILRTKINDEINFKVHISYDENKINNIIIK